ncbi:MAG: ArsR/SmtB family transcription factor [Candidatus Woesearchaeota archaeon]
MSKKNFLMLSLDDDKINKVANVVSNASCKKILDYLATQNVATESKISEDLKIPASTINYNMKQLINAGLVEADEYHYSKKGREILHYKLANKYIIIAPKKERGLKSIIKKILPSSLILASVGFLYEIYNTFKYKFSNQATELEPLAKTDTMQVMVNSQDLTTTASSFTYEPSVGFWIIISAISLTILYVSIEYLKKK